MPVSLAEARELAVANRELVHSGGDSIGRGRRVQDMSTVADVARRVLEQKQGGRRGPPPC